MDEREYLGNLVIRRLNRNRFYRMRGPSHATGNRTRAYCRFSARALRNQSLFEDRAGESDSGSGGPDTLAIWNSDRAGGFGLVTT